jgi:TRAP transporter TAXI family solute receptor
VAAVTLLALLLLGSCADEPRVFRIATASRGGTYYPIGRHLARILADLPEFSDYERVRADTTDGSIQNVHLLAEDSADLALVMGPALLQATEAEVEDLRVLAHLYTDVLHIVVPTGRGINTPGDLMGLSVYAGAEGSGTRLVAEMVLEALDLTDASITLDPQSRSLDQAADAMLAGELDAGLFASGMPTLAVRRLLESGEFKLLGLPQQPEGPPGFAGLPAERIPANQYDNQPNSVESVGAPVFLVGRSDLPEDLAFTILDGLFDHVSDLLWGHTRAQDIKVTEAFDSLPENPRRHPAVDEFREAEKEVVLIATGAIGGKYFGLGQELQDQLEHRGIAARAMQTDGSVENASLLQGWGSPTLAVMQYDAALASAEDPETIYWTELPGGAEVPHVDDLRRIAALHEEMVHLVVRRDKLADLEEGLNAERTGSDRRVITSLNELDEALRESPPGEKLRICLGPEKSATRRLAQAIIQHSGVDTTRISQMWSPVSEMISGLRTGEIHAGFIVSYVPGEAIEAILNDPHDFRLLSLGPRELNKLVGNVFSVETIPPGTYYSQRAGEPGIRTLATRAVLVTREGLSGHVDVEKVAEAVLDGRTRFPVSIDEESLVQELPSLWIHPDAKAFYEDQGLLTPEVGVDWAFWALIISLLMGAGGILGALNKFVVWWRRDRTLNEVGRRILAVPLAADVPDSVERLLNLKEEIEERVQRRWWQPGEINESRWRYLRNLINVRASEAKDNLTGALLDEIRTVSRDPDLDGSARLERYQEIEGKVLDFCEDHELDSLQRDMLRDLLRERIWQTRGEVVQPPPVLGPEPGG